MKYISHINSLMKEKIAATEEMVVFGQNVSTGSCIGGLTRGVKPGKNGQVINSPNAENTLTGMGFGLMMGGVHSVFYMKQLDFLMLGVDHLVNTYNFIRLKKPTASFTICPVVVDLGYQGMQSSFNALGDLGSIARIDTFTLTNKVDSEEIIRKRLVSPGFRIISPSQRLFHSELIDPGPPVYISPDSKIFQYSKGSDLTIVCFNFSFPYAWNIYQSLKEQGKSVSLFSVNSSTPTKWNIIKAEAERCQNLLIIDDSKSANTSSSHLIENIDTELVKVNCLRREFTREWYTPNADQLPINIEKVLEKIGGKYGEAQFSYT